VTLGNIPTKFELFTTRRFRIRSYVRDRQTDGRTDSQQSSMPLSLYTVV